jgi:hypothetical protein
MKQDRFQFIRLKTAILLPVFIALIFFVSPRSIIAQEYIRDTVIDVVVPIDTVPQTHSAHKATIYSLALPGLGQAYNKKYWKIPIIYAGFGVLAYNISINNKETKLFTDAYRYVVKGDTTIPTDNEYVKRYPNPNDLLRGRDFYRRRVELSIIFTAAWYLLNVVDAAVDAHFFDYDVSEDLSLRIEPVIINSPFGNPGTGGIRLCMNF